MMPEDTSCISCCKIPMKRCLVALSLCLLSLPSSSASGLVGPGTVTSYGGAAGARRQYGVVREPALGFFVGGSNINELNGLYSRVERIPRDVKHTFQLAYRHEQTGWLMGLVNKPEDGRYEVVGHHDSEWVLIDDKFQDRFGHEGNTILPGSGTRWQHVHRNMDGKSASHEVSDSTKGDDDMNLPWTIIGIMGADMMENIRRHKAYREHTVLLALQGHGLPEVQEPGSQEVEPPEDDSQPPAAAEDAMERGKFDDAVQHFAQALADEEIKAAPSQWRRAVLHLGLAQSHRKLQKFDVAQAEVAKALQLYPRYKAARLGRGMIHLDAGEPAKAIHQFELLLKMDREWPEINRWLVMANVAMQRQAKAQDDQQKDGEIPSQQTEHCMAWRQTGGCSPNGPREGAADKGCKSLITNGQSGFCECRSMQETWSGIPSITMSVTHLQLGDERRFSCHHDSFTCAEVCAEDWKAAIAKAEATEANWRDNGSGDEALQALKAREAAQAHREQEGKRLAAAGQQVECNGAMIFTGNKMICSDDHTRKRWDNYFVLGLTRDFSPEELRKGFRRQSLKMHPDKEGGSEKAFESVAKANLVFSKPEERQKYDEGFDMNKQRKDYEEHEPVTVKDEILRKYFPEKFSFDPFGEDYKQQKTRHYEEIQQRLAQQQPSPDAAKDDEEQQDESDEQNDAANANDMNEDSEGDSDPDL